MALTICYFGIYQSDFSRNRIYIRGLRENGVEIVECADHSPGFKKFFHLFRQHQKIKNDYAVMIVGYPGHLVVPFAKLISNKPVVFDALASLYEGEIISRQRFSRWSPRAWLIWSIDFMACLCADLILVETNAQKHFFQKTFFVSSQKIVRLFTGADDQLFYPMPDIKKAEQFTALFRGKFLPEAGVETIIQAAKILENQARFMIIGNGFLEKKVRELLAEQQLANVELITDYLSYDRLRELMNQAHVSLGQFADHPRLARTIPHKAFETLAVGLPYVTARSTAVQELLTDQENCLLVKPADPVALAKAIITLKNNPALAKKLGANGHALYLSTSIPVILGKNLRSIIAKHLRF